MIMSRMKLGFSGVELVSLKVATSRTSMSAKFKSSCCSNILCLSVVVVAVAALMGSTGPVVTVEGLPFPAPKMEHCMSTEGCCTPAVTTGDPAKFEFPSGLPMRIRPAAHLVDDAYTAKYQRAYELMKALPDTDGRSHANQARLHCAYCDNNFYFPGNSYPLEIHNNWLFLPWHRLYLYFHERILAKLLDDDTFTLPFWNWDNQSRHAPQGNVVPRVYADPTGYGPHKNASFLYDQDRNACAKRPQIVSFSVPPLSMTCPNNQSRQSRDAQRAENAHLLYTQMVTAAVTPLLFFGQPYRFGDNGGVGSGALEVKPHEPVHLWVNFQDMVEFKDSAKDPIFFAHHANVDRMWSIWKTLPGGIRNDLTDPDWLNTEFTFYDENGKLVSASVAQSLDTKLLRYEYQHIPTPWVTGAVEADEKPSRAFCNRRSATSDILTMIKHTKPFRSPTKYTTGPLTFKVRRPAASSTGEEVLELRGNMDWTKQVIFDMFLYLPTAGWDTTSIGCPEFLGVFITSPHVGVSPNIPRKLVWRVGLAQKLRDMRRESLSHIVVTMVGQPVANQTLLLTSARVLHTES